MKKFVIIFFIIYLAPLIGQSVPDTTYQVELISTVSPMFNFFKNPKYPGDDNKFHLGYGMALRCMWHPARKLAIGVMTGYYLITKDKISSVALNNSADHPTALLTAIPIQFAVSMQNKVFELGIGVGPYMMMSTLSDQHGDEDAFSSRFEYGITFFCAYYFYLFDKLKIGPELRGLYLGFRGIYSIMPSLTIKLDTFRY